MMTLYLWDASDYDWDRGPMDLHAAKADGIVGFTHKATEATWIKHVHTGEALARARDAGMEFVGAYHVVRSTSPAEQVDYFLAYLDQVAAWWRTFPGFFLQVDLEIWDYDRVTAATGMEFARLLVAAQPKKVITYASRGQYGDSLAGIVTPLWNANYGSNPVAHYPAAYPGDGSSRWTAYSGQVPVFLQYGSQLTIGTQPGCDANAYRGTLADLRALITGDSMTAQEVWGYPLSNADGQNGNAGEYLGGANQYAYHGGQAAWRAEYLLRGLAGMTDPIVIPANDRLDIVKESVPNKLAQALLAGGSGSGLTPQELAQVSGAAHDGAAGAIDGATVSGAVISTKKP